MNFHAITNAFSHTHGGCASFPPKEKWHYSLPNSIDINNPTVFVDNQIPMGLQFPKTGKFGWLCESSSIVHHLKGWMVSNISLLEKSYEKIFVNDESLLSLSSVFEYVPPASNMPWIKDWGVFEKTELVSIIASSKRETDGHRMRHAIIDSFPDKISVFGNGYKSIETKDEGIKPFMFSFCIENAKYDLYYTEKVLDAIACGTVPIYWGTDKIKTLFNPDGFIFFDGNFSISSLSTELYESKMKALEENLEILKSFEPSDDTVHRAIKRIIENG